MEILLWVIGGWIVVTILVIICGLCRLLRRKADEQYPFIVEPPPEPKPNEHKPHP